MCHETKRQFCTILRLTVNMYNIMPRSYSSDLQQLMNGHYFGHIARANPSMDHSRALRASVAPLPRDWNRRAGRPRVTWLRTVESDFAPFNIGLATAYHRVQNRQAWSKLVRTATSSSGQAT